MSNISGCGVTLRTLDGYWYVKRTLKEFWDWCVENGWAYCNVAKAVQFK